MPVLSLDQELPARLNFELDPESGRPGAGLPASLDFNLCQDLPASLDFDLARSPCDGAGGELVEGVLSAAAVTDCSFLGQSGVCGVLSATGDQPTADFAGEWDPNVWRGTVRRPRIVHSAGSARQACIGVPWQFSEPRQPAKAVAWRDGAARLSETCLRLSDLFPAPRSRDISFSPGTPLAGRVREPFILTWPRYRIRRGSWETGEARSTGHGFLFALCWPRPAGYGLPYQAGRPGGTERTNFFRAARRSGAGVCNPWQPARRPVFIWPLPEPDLPEPEYFSGSAGLELRCLLPEPLWGGVVFDLGNAEICRQALPVGWIPPAWQPRKVIIVVHHDLYIKLLSDGSIIEADAIELSLDRDAWGWNWGAEIKERRADLLTTQHQVEIGIDGFTWRGIVETFSGSREHGGQGWRLGGRSPAALFSTPYTAPRSRSESSDRTARQLAEDEIAGSGWSFNWQIIDWLVPGGTFGYGNATPIAAVKMITRAAGGLVQAHATDQVLIVAPRYAVPPWELNAADPSALAATIPLDLVLEEAITWRPETLVRGVWVSGRSAGVRCRVYRSGSDGVPYGEMIVDPLITEVAAARERGRDRLAASGKRREVTLTLPLTAETGALKPGDLIEVADAPAWRGYLDRVRISATRITVRQGLTIEHITEY